MAAQPEVISKPFSSSFLYILEKMGYFSLSVDKKFVNKNHLKNLILP
jgi:hypothetical protein